MFVDTYSILQEGSWRKPLVVTAQGTSDLEYLLGKKVKGSAFGLGNEYFGVLKFKKDGNQMTL